MPPDVPALVAALTQGETPRVWSLLVTVFGDLAQGPQARVSGVLLARLTEAMGIKPEAARVALHRLRKDGWIESLREGRRSSYRLTQAGHRETAAASPRIYGVDKPPGEGWLLIHPPAEPAPPGAVAIGPGLALGAAAQGFALPLQAPPPDWLRARVVDAELVALTRTTAVGFAALAVLPALTPLETAALRVLVVHAWRRIALRAPDLPDFLFPEGWQGPACRAAAADLLRRLPRPDLATLEAAAGP